MIRCAKAMRPLARCGSVLIHPPSKPTPLTLGHGARLSVCESECRHSRHPNYFGEILMWWGVFGAAAGSLPWAQVAAASASPLFVSLLLMYVSGVPLLEKSAEERWGDDPAYQVCSVCLTALEMPALTDPQVCCGERITGLEDRPPTCGWRAASSDAQSASLWESLHSDRLSECIYPSSTSPIS
jgi:hypothetical protein